MASAAQKARGMKEEAKRTQLGTVPEESQKEWEAGGHQAFEGGLGSQFLY